MDKYATTIDTYNKSAVNFQNKFMDMDLYNSTYDKFCNLIEKQNASVFEIACGPGNITKYLLSKRPEFKIVGIDLSAEMIKLARINNPTAEFLLMDCRDIYKINNKYDAIMCGFCFPYLSKKECAKMIRDMFSILNINGVVYISAMEGDYNKSGYEKTSFSGNHQVYIHYHQAGFLTNTLKGAGFKNIELIRQNYPEPDGTFSTDMIFLAKK